MVKIQFYYARQSGRSEKAESELAEALHATGVVLRVGNRVGVATISLFHPSAPDELVAEAKGVYSVKRA